MKSFPCPLLFLLLLSNSLYAQQPASQALYGELAGTSFLYSINYLYQLESPTNDQWEIRAGASRYGFFPVMLNAGFQRVFSTRPHRLVAGVYGSWASAWSVQELPGSLGLFDVADIRRVHYATPSAGIGYRWEGKKQLFLQVQGLALASFLIEGTAPAENRRNQLEPAIIDGPGWQGFIPWFSVGIGWKLRNKD